MQAEQLTLPLPEAMNFSAAFNLNVSSGTINGPVQMAVPVGPAIPVGETVYFFVEIESSLAGGVPQKYWAAVDSGVVGADGYARSTSPPWPGLSTNGNILVARAAQPIRQITIDLSNFFNPALLLMGSTSLVGLMAYLATVTFPIAYQAANIVLWTTWAGKPLELNIPIGAGAGNERIRVTVPTPPLATGSPPTINGQPVFNPATAEITIDGANFGTGSGTVVAFRQGGKEIEARPVSATDTKIVVKVPNSVVLGLAEIVVKRPNTPPGSIGTAAVASSRWIESGLFRIFNPGGYSFTGGSRFADGQFSQGVFVVDTNRKGDPSPAPEQVIKTIDLGRFVVATEATSDLARAFALVSNAGDKPPAVAVIDGVTLSAVDQNRDTPELDLIDLEFNGVRAELPGAMTLDPLGHYLYIASGRSIWVIDINPGSDKLHKVVDVIAIPSTVTTTDRIRGLAVNADGTRLYITAPETELFGGTRGWASGGREAGKVLVMNVNEADRPVPSVAVPNPPNLRNFRKIIGELDGGLEPYGIKPTAFADKMIFTSRLKGAGGFGLATITVTNDDPTSYAATVKTIPLTLSTNVQQRYQLSIKNPVDVAITPNLEWAFVLDWYVPLTIGSGAQSSMIEYMDTHDTGSKVGVVKDPFGLRGTPQLLAATSPIPLALATEIELSSDNKKLYTNYRLAGDILVFDVDKLTQKAELVPRDQLTRRPIDNLGSADPRPDIVVNFPGIAVSNRSWGLAVQPYDPLTLISPQDSRDLQNGPLTFKWDVDTDQLGTTNYKVQVFVSTLPPGQGLWPDDAPRPRFSKFEAEPTRVIGKDFEGSPVTDNNPNRVWTSELLPAGTEQVELPFDPTELTAGQRYYWGVKLFANGQTFSEATGFVAKAVDTRTTYNGVTVLTHGFQLGASLDDGAYQQPEAFMALAHLIADASGGGVVLSYNKNTGEWFDQNSRLSGTAALQSGKAVVLVSDWYKESDISDAGFAEAAADAMYASLADLNNRDQRRPVRDHRCISSATAAVPRSTAKSSSGWRS